MTARPPINVDVTERTFYGVSLRTGVILGLTAVPVFIVAFLIGGLPLWLRGGLAVLMTGLGLSLAFGQIGGRTPEAWLIEWFNFRGRKRFFVHRAQKQAAEPSASFAPPKADQPATASTEAKPRARPVHLATATSARPAAPSFVFLTANTLGLAVLTALTLYMAQGGADRLASLLRPF